MKQIRWAGEARQDIERIRDFYLDDDTSNFATIAAAIVSAAHFTSERPKAGPRVNAYGHRKWPVKRFPYLILYRVAKTHIRIVRVVHGASDWASLI